jgi:hypothetical protein
MQAQISRLSTGPATGAAQLAALLTLSHSAVDAVTSMPAALLPSLQQRFGFMASVAMATPVADADLRELRVQFVVEAVAAILLLLVITALWVFKPRGLTPYGSRKQREQRQVAQA